MSSEAAFEIGRLWPLVKQIADTISASKDKIFLELPGLVAWYPSGPVGVSGSMLNVVAEEGDMLEVGTNTIGYDGHPYRKTGGGTNYLSYSPGWHLSGTEAYISASIRGFTIGGWFNINSLPAANAGLVSKDAPSPERGYRLQLSSAGANILFGMSGNGASVVVVTTATPGTGQWIFVAGRFLPANEIALFVDGTKNVFSTAIPSSGFNSDQNFEIGRYNNDNDRVFDGKCRDVFVCRAGLDDQTIEEIRETSTP